MLWNVQGINKKLNDEDFLTFISDFDLLIFTETWNAQNSNIDIKGYDCVNCPRPKFNRSAKRNSGGVALYYKEQFKRYIQVLDRDEKGIIWFKLSKELILSENDAYYCICYIPPEDSAVYRNVNSSLHNFDFFEQINSDVRKYSDLGDIYLLGDLNSRTGLTHDYISDIHLDRYVNMPQTAAVSLPVRKNHDSHVNNYGLKLLTLCKENDLCIVNGRKECGKCTFNATYRNRPVSSLVDYVIVNKECYNYIANMCVMDINEYSDHCPVVFTLQCAETENDESVLEYDKIVWDSTPNVDFLDLVESKCNIFDSINEKLLSGETDINECMKSFTDTVYDISYTCYGKSFTNRPKKKKRKSLWFDEQCRNAKSVFCNMKRCFIADNSDENKLAFLNARKQFMKVKRCAKNRFYRNEKIQISNISKNSPRKFWNYIKKFKNAKKDCNNISMDEFKNYFETISNERYGDFCTENLPSENNDDIDIESLDRKITVEEIEKTISSMKRLKSCDYDDNVADFYIDAKSLISPFLCTLFNYIYDNCIYPEAWSKGVIVPIYKKGDCNMPSNYRGITLVNTMGKIFSLILRNRINNWCESESVFNDSQYGFREGRSTADAIFVLHSVIQKVLSKNSKLWCAFIDYQRAFDSVNRDALGIKLIQSGISCKMTNMIKCIYENVQSCVKLSNRMNMSDFFDVTIGLKQGEPLSPLLFILFVNDITDNIDLNSLTDKDYDLLSMFLILFADDIVLFTTDPGSLQAQLDSLYHYSTKWGLKINANKTKVCCFEKRKQNAYPEFYINGEVIELVDNFTYLGLNFTHNGNMSSAVKTLNEQALRAYSSLLSMFDKVSLDVKTKLSLFDSMVVPILTYSSEVWGVYNYKEVDKLHIRFLKYILGVKNQTPTMALYGETGRFPLSVICKERSIKFWTKIMKNNELTISKMYFELCNNVNNKCWAKRINSIIDHLGFTNLRLNFDPRINCFNSLKTRLRDQFIQEWKTSISSMTKLDQYCKYKTEFKFEPYLVNIVNDKLRKC